MDDPSAPGRSARHALRDAWRSCGTYPDLTIGEAIVEGCTANAQDQIVFAHAGAGTETVALGALLDRAADRAARLTAAGVTPGDTVLVPTPADLSGTAT